MCKDNETTEALALRPPGQVQDFVYARMTGNPIAAAETMGAALAKSKLFGVENADQGMVLALEAMHRQTSIMDLARQYHVIKGRLSMRADAMQAEFQADHGRIEWSVTTDKACEARFSHPSYAPDPVTVRWAIEDATRAGLKGGNWTTYPRQMLRARVISEGVRMVHPGILVGVYTPEEVQDFGSPARPTQRPALVDAKAEPAERKPAVPALTGAPAKAVLWGKTQGVGRTDLEMLIGKPAAEWGDEDLEEIRRFKEGVAKAPDRAAYIAQWLVDIRAWDASGRPTGEAE